MMEDNKVELFDGDKNLILRSKISKNRTFHISLEAVESSECMASVKSSEESWLWHLRYGHLNFKSLQQLSMKEMVYGLPEIVLPEKVCETCMVRKQMRKSFKTHLSMSVKDCLGAVHSDICGPTEVPTIAGNRYFITFIDEYSRMIWVYLVKVKSDTLKTFIRFKAHVERESDR